MTAQLTRAIQSARPEDRRTFVEWVAHCSQAMATRPDRPGMLPQAALLGGLVVALRQPGDGLNPTLVAATVTAREADPTAFDVIVGVLRAVVRPAWAALAAVTLAELLRADADGRRQVADAERDAQALDGVPPELKD